MHQTKYTMWITVTAQCAFGIFTLVLATTASFPQLILRFQSLQLPRYNEIRKIFPNRNNLYPNGSYIHNLIFSLTEGLG
jgi:hypothetical protein